MINLLVGIEHGDFPDDVTKATKYFTRFHVETSFDEIEQPENTIGKIVATHTIMQDIRGLTLGEVDLSYAKIGSKIKLVGLKNLTKKTA
jgi:hypothetical protein